MWIHPRETVVIGREAIAVPTNLQLLGLFLALNLADIVLTHVNITLGIALEANPVLLMVIERYGWGGLYGFKVLGPILLTLAILPSSRIMTSRRFSYFLVVICLLSLTGVCSGIYVSMTSWVN
ncbi:MAG: hypothetical protein DRP71_14890 [Verrucomicrobia bacterium]|nr:MAG: hypothetical protein DRP71_14890 [Verrucomicrobiota bacterium]